MEVISCLELKEQNYTTTQIGKMFNISANKIDRIANDNNMKINAYGVSTIWTSHAIALNKVKPFFNKDKR